MNNSDFHSYVVAIAERFNCVYPLNKYMNKYIYIYVCVCVCPYLYHIYPMDFPRIPHIFIHISLSIFGKDLDHQGWTKFIAPRRSTFPARWQSLSDEPHVLKGCPQQGWPDDCRWPENPDFREPNMENPLRNRKSCFFWHFIAGKKHGKTSSKKHSGF